MKLPLPVFLVLDAMTWTQDAFQYLWDDLSDDVFPSFNLLRPVFEINAFDKSLHGPGSLSLTAEGVVCRSVGSSGGRTCRATPTVESSGPASHQKVSLESGDIVASCMEVIRCLVCRAGFSREVMEVIASDIRGSTAAF